jgi:hypothetical protein
MRNDTRQNNTQLNDIEHNDSEYKGLVRDALRKQRLATQ